MTDVKDSGTSTGSIKLHIVVSYTPLWTVRFDSLSKKIHATSDQIAISGRLPGRVHEWLKKARGLLTKIYYCSGDVDRASSAMTESTDMRPSGGDAAAALQVCLLSLPHEHVNFNSNRMGVAVRWEYFWNDN